jgi:hypothetical protein
MFISVKHSISNPQEFWSIAEKAISNLPAGIKLHSSLPTSDMGTAFCLWEVDSFDGFKDYLESATRHVSKNDYFVIDEKVAIGLPK